MILLAVIVAVAGGMIALRLKVPAGALIGAIFGVAALNLILDSEILFPMQIKFFTQAMTGAYVGSRIRKSDVLALRGILVPTVILSITMLLFNVVISWFLYVYTSLSLETALFATAPAGVTDMTLASMDFDADAPKVAVLQMVRLLSVLSIMPWIIKWVNHRRAVNQPADQPTESVPQSAEKHGFAQIANTLVIGLCFGGVGYLAGIPAGAITFAMVGCAMYNIWHHDAYIPLRLRQYIQFVAGALIGGMVTRTQIFEIAAMLHIVFIVVVGFLIFNLTTATLLHRLGGMDPTTALLASSAGGLTDMAIIAEELGADSAKVATMQLIRVVSVIALYPTIISKLLDLF